MPRNGFLSWSGPEIQSISRRMNLVVVVGALRAAEDDGAGVLVPSSRAAHRRSAAGGCRARSRDSSGQCRRGRASNAPDAERSGQARLMARTGSCRKRSNRRASHTPIRFMRDFKARRAAIAISLRRTSTSRRRCRRSSQRQQQMARRDARHEGHDPVDQARESPAGCRHQSAVADLGHPRRWQAEQAARPPRRPAGRRAPGIRWRPDPDRAQ